MEIAINNITYILCYISVESFPFLNNKGRNDCGLYDPARFSKDDWAICSKYSMVGVWR